MKKLLYSVIMAASLIFGLSSCQGFLDETPTDAVAAEDAMKTIEDAGVAVNGLYGKLMYYTLYGTYTQLMGDYRADILYPAKNSKSATAIYQLDYDPTQNSYFGTYWSNYYGTINRCNTFLENIDELEVPQSEQEIKDNFIGEAKAVRALCYFDLANIYGYPYLRDNGASLGAALILKSLNKDEAINIERTTVAKTYEQVVTDLTESISLLSDKRNTGHFNAWAAKVLLARVYLYMGKYSDAYSLAVDVIEHSPYSLVSNKDYKEYWGKEGADETVLEFLVSLGDGDIDSDGGFYTMHQWLWFETNGGLSLVPTKKWRAAFGDPDDPLASNDVRAQMLIKHEYSNGTSDWWLKKFIGNQDRGFTWRRNNPHVIRITEAYLIAAECGARTGKQEKADQYLNEIRKRADPTATAITATVESVLNERYKEFIGEGFRFWDLMRTHNYVHRDYDYDVQDYAGEPKEYGEKVKFDWDFYKVAMPIAESEIAICPNLQQNPGYK